MSRKMIFAMCCSVLAVALAGCSFQVESSPTALTAVPATVLSPATETLPPPPTSTLTPQPSPTVTLAPTDTPEAPSPLPPTDTPPSPASPITAGPVITHLSLGQAIKITLIHMLDSADGWAIGGEEQASDHVFTTTDGGQSWRDVTPPEPLPATGQPAALGFFPDANTAWVTYYIQQGITVPATAVVWRTQDGGQSWQSSAPLDLQGLNELYYPSDLVFASSQAGWLLVHVGVGMSHDYVVLYRTTDGGQTWTRLIDPYGTSGIQGCQKNGLVFPSDQIGWLTGNCNGVMAGALLFHSVDSGQTWQSVTLPAPAEAPDLFSESGPACGTQSPIFLSPQAGKLIVRCDDFTHDPAVTSFYLYATQDGGVTWTETSSPAGILAFLTEDAGWAFSRTLFHTTDAGETWTKVVTVNWDGQFSFVSDTLGWAVARAASDSGTAIALVHTEAGGRVWAEIHPVVAP